MLQYVNKQLKYVNKQLKYVHKPLKNSTETLLVGFQTLCHGITIPLKIPFTMVFRPKNGRIFCAALRETSLGVTLVSAQYHQNVAVSSCFYIKSASSSWLLGENLGSMAFPFCSINLALVDTDARDVFLPAKRNEGWHQTVMWQSEHITIFLPEEDGASHSAGSSIVRYRVKYSSRKISFRSFFLWLLFESIFLDILPRTKFKIVLLLKLKYFPLFALHGMNDFEENMYQHVYQQLFISWIIDKLFFRHFQVLLSISITGVSSMNTCHNGI